jgi:hypothetical protein
MARIEGRGRHCSSRRHVARCTVHHGVVRDRDRVLMESPLVRQLRSLSLPNVQLTDNHARMMSARAGAFKRLERLDVSGNQLTRGAIRDLHRVASCVIADDQAASLGPWSDY